MQKMKRLLLTLMVLVNFLVFPGAVQAGYWGEPTQASLMEIYINRALTAFDESLRASLKIQASQLIMGRIEALLTGSSSGPLYIQNYEEFIYTSAQNQSQIYINNFFNSLASGVSTTTAEMLHGVHNAVNNEIYGVGLQAQATLDDYVDGGLNSMFNQSRGGGHSAFMQTMGNPYNNPYGAFIKTTDIARYDLMVRQDLARVQAVANEGFINKVDPNTNIIQTPGSLIKDLTAFAESLPMQIVAFADSIPEVIGTMAAQVLSETIEKGIRKVTDPIDNQLIDIHNTVEGGIYEVQDKIYEGIKFTY